MPFQRDGDANILSPYTVVYSYYVEPNYRFQFEVTEYMYVRTNNPNGVTMTVNGERVVWYRDSW